MGLPLGLGEIEQLEGALDVDLVAGHRGELGAGREQRREVVDRLDLVLGEDPFEQVGLEDRAQILVLDQLPRVRARGVGDRW